jgi:hypothetical protein
MSLYDLSLDQMGMLHMVVGSALECAIENEAPRSVTNNLESICKVIELEIDKRCIEFNEFQSIAESLDDLELASKIIFKNPEAITTDYN